MPELPEIETVARTLRPRLVGRRLLGVEASGKPLRQPVDLKRLRAACKNARVEAVRRTGKYLLVDLSNAQVLVAHLGMTGRFLFAARGTAWAPHTHAVFRLEAGIDLRFVDPRRFGILRSYPRAELAASPELSVLGMDPLDPGFTVEHLAALLGASRRPLKSFLLDQSRLAGLGNIYACEALFRAGLGPRRRAHRVGIEAARRLHAAIGRVLDAAVANRGTSFSDYVDAEGSPGENQNLLAVYGRAGEPCLGCGGRVRRLVQTGRSTFYCPRCQR